MAFEPTAFDSGGFHTVIAAATKLILQFSGTFRGVFARVFGRVN